MIQRPWRAHLTSLAWTTTQRIGHRTCRMVQYSHSMMSKSTMQKSPSLVRPFTWSDSLCTFQMIRIEELGDWLSNYSLIANAYPRFYILIGYVGIQVEFHITFNLYQYLFSFLTWLMELCVYGFIGSNKRWSSYWTSGNLSPLWLLWMFHALWCCGLYRYSWSVCWCSGFWCCYGSGTRCVAKGG